MRPVATGSSAEQGSSIRSICGLVASARAIHSRCCWPPERVRADFFRSSRTSSQSADAFQRVLKGKNDGFVTKLSSDGKSLVFSTLLGGSGGEFFLTPTVDGEGNIFVVGHTTSSDFPITPDALQTAYHSPKGARDGDGVLAVLNPDGSALVYATFLGGSGDDLIRSVAIGPGGEVYLIGSTSSKDFPVAPNAVQTRLAGSADAFVVKLVPMVR